MFKYLVFYMCVGVVYAEENGKKIAKEKENTSKSISYEKYSTTEWWEEDMLWCIRLKYRYTKHEKKVNIWKNECITSSRNLMKQHGVKFPYNLFKSKKLLFDKSLLS